MKIKPVFVVLLVVTLNGMGSTLCLADIGILSAPLREMPGGTITGPVTNVDPVNQTIQLKAANGLLQKFVIDPEIVILKNEKPTSLDNVNVGDVVTLTVVTSDSNS